MLITSSMTTTTLPSSSALLVLLLLVTTTTTNLQGVVGTTTTTTTTTSSAKESSESATMSSSSRTAQALRRWIEDAEGGLVHPAVELLPRRVPLHPRHSSPSQQQQRPLSWWFAAKGPLRKGEVIAVIPDTHVFQPSTTAGSSSSSADPTMTTTELFSWCDMVAAVDQELERGDSSFYAPLFHHLQEVALDVFPIPSVWSSPSRHLLRQLLSLPHDDDHHDDVNHTHHPRPTYNPSWNLPPRDPVEWITHDYVTNCYDESSHNHHNNHHNHHNHNNDNDENDNESSSSSSSFLLSGRSILAAAMTVTWKEEGFRIIPLSSLFLHRNGPHTNIDMGRRRSRRSDGTTVTTAFHVVALRDIAPGEFISWSHNLCNECGRRRQGDYGTAGM